MNEQKYTYFEILRVGDLKSLLNCSYSKAYRNYQDIKEEFGVKDVLYVHFLRYYGLETERVKQS